MVSLPWLSISVAAENTNIENANSNSKSRKVNDIVIDTASLTGIFEDGKALLTLKYSFYVSNNETNFTLPLVGPADKAMAINLTVDGMERRVEFSNAYYYIFGKFPVGKHNVSFEFNSNLLFDEIIALNYTLYGPTLSYLIEFKIPINPGTKIFLIERGDGIIYEETKNILLRWEYFAMESEYWSLSWTEYKPPTPTDIRCEIISEVMIYEDKAVLEVNYNLEFKGFAFDEIALELDSGTILRTASSGTITIGTKKTRIKFDKLIKDDISLKLTFEKWFITELEITIPQPLNCKINGDVALFSELNVIIDLVENSQTILIGYSGITKSAANFIGNYHFTENSKLIFNVTLKETTVTAEIVDTLIPTFDGYDIESWILFNFHGNSPNSITLDLSIVGSSGKSQKPQLISDPIKPLPILDHNWNGNLNRLTLWLKSNISNEYLLGLHWSFAGNNVTMEESTIADTQIMGYYVAYYLEKGVVLKNIFDSGLTRTGYDALPQQLRAYLHIGTNVEIYQANKEYLSILTIEKTSDLTSEIFLRVWVSDVGMDVHQIVRITSESSITSAFIFSIPSGVTSINVQDCASWTMLEHQLIVYPFKTATNLITFYIDAKFTNASDQINPFIPLEIEECKIYTMFGTAANLNITIATTSTVPLNPDELPKYFLSEIKTPKAVKVYYSTEEATFNVKTEKYTMEEPPTTVIEFAQITFITSVDGKIAVQAIYMVKNADRVEMHVTIPANGLVWMVLVSGKTIPIIQNGDLLTITLIRSTLTGENIAFPVEIVYMTIEPTENFEFMIPQVDVSILNLKVNIGLPSSINILDPEEFNPTFELESWDKWKTKKKLSSTGSELYTDYVHTMNSQLSGVSYDKSIIEPDWVYVGLDDLDGDSDILEIERLDVPEGENGIYTMKIDHSNSYFDNVSNKRFAKISLSQGQYELRNSGVKRQVTVMGGATQQIIFDSDEEMVFTDVPPIYLQFPQSGQVLRLAAIFIKPNESTSVTLVEGKVKESTLVNDISSLLNSSQFLKSIIILFIILTIVLIYLLVFRKSREKTSKKEQQMATDKLKDSNDGQKSTAGASKKLRVRKTRITPSKKTDKKKTEKNTEKINRH
jgi:hypothetical protein